VGCKTIIPAEAGIQDNTGCRIGSGMTNDFGHLSLRIDRITVRSLCITLCFEGTQPPPATHAGQLFGHCRGDRPVRLHQRRFRAYREAVSLPFKNLGRTSSSSDRRCAPWTRVSLPSRCAGYACPSPARFLRPTISPNSRPLAAWTPSPPRSSSGSSTGAASGRSWGWTWLSRVWGRSV